MISTGTDKLILIGAAVAELRADFPDVSHSSLRFLEREGLISSHRTTGGHRLYSSNVLDRVRLIKRWQAARIPLAEVRERLETLDHIPNLDAVADQFLSLITGGDLTGARRAVRQAAEAGVPLIDLFDGLLRPALYEVGRRWESGQMLVPQEKEVSELTRDLIAELTPEFAVEIRAAPSMVGACVEGEQHQLGLRMVCGALSARGYPIHYLGASISEQFLAESVHTFRPSAVLLSVTIEQNRHRIRPLVESVERTRAGDPVPVFVGGQGAADMEPGSPELAGARLVTGNLAVAVGQVEKLVPLHSSSG